MTLFTNCSKSNSSGIENVGNVEKHSINITNTKLEIKNENSEIETAKNDKSDIFDCSDPKSYKVEEDRNDKFHIINFIQNNEVVGTLKTPTGLTYNGFALNWARKTKLGFEVSIEYGSRFYYEKNFEFICKNHQLYLTRIKITTFDKNNPENSWKESKKVVKPNISLSNFEITDYITEFGN